MKVLIWLVPIGVVLSLGYSISIAQIGGLNLTDGDIDSAGVRASILAGGINPDNPSSLLKLLANESIQEELSLSDAQKQALKQVHQNKSKQIMESLGVGNSTPEKIREYFTSEKVREYFERERTIAESTVGEILTPNQSRRLRQLVYHIDISRLGIAESLTLGRLGAMIGIVDNQKTALMERAKKIESKAREEIIRIRKAAHDEVLKELSTEQQKKAEELLGEYFEYAELTTAQQVTKDLRSSLLEKKRKK